MYGTMAGMTGFITKSPTAHPTTKSPTKSPTAHPTTKSPTESPTDSPTKSPTDSPTKSPTESPTERCNANNCMNWACSDWCECYDENAVDIYNSHQGCMDDNEDTCICFEEQAHERYGERHRKINYNQDNVDADLRELIEGTDIHTATKQHHYN